MRARGSLILLVVVVCAGLGLLIAGIPGGAEDRPLSVRSANTPDAQSSTGTTTTTTTSTTTTTPAPPPLRAPTDVRIRVANASTLGMAATHMGTRVSGMGYQVLGPLNANRSDLTTTVLVFNPGFELEARVLAQSLGASKVVAADPTLTCSGQACGGDVVVFVGSDLAT